MWFQPSPSFGYTIREIDGHPWNYLLSMKELRQLEPGTIRFTGPNAEEHTAYWKEQHPEFFSEQETTPLFIVDTTPTKWKVNRGAPSLLGKSSFYSLCLLLVFFI